MYLGGFAPSALRAARMPGFFRKPEQCPCAARVMRKAERSVRGAESAVSPRGFRVP